MPPGKTEISQLVLESIMVVGGSAPKKVILRAVSTTASTQVRKVMGPVNKALNEFIRKGVVREQEGNYYINTASTTRKAKDKRPLRVSSRDLFEFYT
ncbi:uncharacterized protein LOC122624344 [Drosophila teissieri]|uniref:uncharacterized protein LOC122624344 n=1 Tax=Drosophila teissieri TaxID=7243 RepID=UPI001CBA08D6|nr:uncharacterized protein LOC122624344 [Drosophila teissieri]